MDVKLDHEHGELQIIRPSKRGFRMLTGAAHAEHYRHNGYEEYTADLISNFFLDGALFIDIGAHHGFYTLLVGTKNKKAKIMAFEPLPENCEILKKNLELSQLSNVELYELAVSDKNETRSFNVSDRSSCCGFYPHPLANTIKTIEVKSITLDSLFTQIPDVPVIVKIDAEGHELHILEGMTRLIEKAADIKLFIEFNPDCLLSAGDDPVGLLNRIRKLGLDIYFLDDERKQAYKLAADNPGNWRTYFAEGNYGKNYFNLLCVPKERSLSICFLSHSAYLNGAERSLLELVTELVRDHGTVCSVVLPEDGPLRGRLEEVGASTIVANYSWWADPGVISKEDIEDRLSRSFQSLISHIRPEIGKFNPDVIVTTTMVIPWGAITAYFLGKPHVWNVREFGILDHGLRFFQDFNLTLDFIQQSSNTVLTTSQAVKEALFGPDPARDIQVLYSYVTIPPDALLQDKASYFHRRGATRLLVSGAIQEGKGQKEAILAVKELVRGGSNVELVLMGGQSSAYVKLLKTLIREENLEAYIQILDFKENPYPVVDQADIVLVCSRNEAFGRVTVEAMLLKKAVIGSNSGGTRELITEGFNGLLYTPGDYIQLADKIKYLIEHKEKTTEFGENGYQFAKNSFTRAAYGGRVYKLLLGLRDKKNPISSPFSDFVMRMVSGISLEFQEELEGQVRQYQGRIVVQLGNRYQRVVEKLLRSGTRGRNYYEVILAGIRTILNEGWRSFWRKFRWKLHQLHILPGPG